MFNVQLVIKRWEGPRFKDKVQEANRRLTGSIAYEGQNEAKGLAHVDSGRMQGSVTVLRPDSGFTVDKHAEPYDYGKDREGAIAEVVMDGERASVHMGAYVPYAFIEEVLRGHRFVQPGMDIARSKIPLLIAQVKAEMSL